MLRCVNNSTMVRVEHTLYRHIHLAAMFEFCMEKPGWKRVAHNGKMATSSALTKTQEQK